MSDGCFSLKKNGVIDRARTGDNQNHNLGLYQLSYDHRWKRANLSISIQTVKRWNGLSTSSRRHHQSAFG